MTIVIGLISGTSVDGIDAALVDVTGKQETLQIELLATLTHPYAKALRTQILAICAGASLSMAELADVDDAIAQTFAETALAIQTDRPQAELIGSHGQTVYHRPFQPLAPSQTNPSEATETQQVRTLKQGKLGYSLQLGRGDLIARLTGIPTVSNFRTADIAVGGHGAPMVPPVDACLLGHGQEQRCVQNLGGIGNVTYLPAQASPNWLQQVRGWDTGPGNSLIDLAVQRFTHGQQQYDRDGAWAAQGKPCLDLVEHWIQHDFFWQPPPKSTGRELFGWDYLEQCLVDASAYALQEADILATLTELTVASIWQSYRSFLPVQPDRILLAGGGSRNLHLRQRLQDRFAPTPVELTNHFGIESDFKEAIAFAILAHWHQQNLPGNLPSVTGAEKAMILGDFYSP